MASSHTAGWTLDRESLVEKLWTVDGLSASQIAARLGGGVTRNAVISKVHRMGLVKRSPAVQTYEMRQRTREPKLPFRPTKVLRRAPIKFGKATEARPVATPPVVTPAPVFVDLPALRIDLLDLRDQHCRWPLGGNPGDEGFHFCGQDRDGKLPYCGKHANAAYQPISRRPSRPAYR